MSAREEMSPQNMMMRPSATNSGLMVLYGITIPKSAGVLPSCELKRASSRSTSLPSHSGYLLVTVGILAKLYSGGGLGIDHSSVPAPHGLGPAISPRFLLTKKL